MKTGDRTCATGRNRSVSHLYKKDLAPAFFVLCLICFCSGCQFSYLLHLAGGQIEVLNGSVPIKKALETEDFTLDQRNNLALVPEIKGFGEAALGLKKTRNYETVYPEPRKTPMYVLSASDKDQFRRKTWWFPVVGDMPYLGFFDLERAREKETELAQQDLDVFLGTAGAYSTLGWFQDPVTMNLINEPTPRLTETLLHEMTHATLYVRGQGAFNEGLAVLVGKVGAVMFFEKKFGPHHPHTLAAKAALTDERRFSCFLDKLMSRLERLYAEALTREQKRVQRKKLYAKAMEEFQILKKNFQTRQFLHFDKAPINNAFLLTVALYHRHFALFEAALSAHNDSISEMIISFKSLDSSKGDLMVQMQQTYNAPIFFNCANMSSSDMKPTCW